MTRRACSYSFAEAESGATKRLAFKGSLDDLVRLQQHRLRDCKPERLRGLQIDHKLELRRPLEGKLGRLRAAEDAVHVHGGALESLDPAGAVGEEPAGI